MIIEQRAKRLASVVPGAEGFPLLRWIQVDIALLRKLTDDYIIRCLKDSNTDE